MTLLVQPAPHFIKGMRNYLNYWLKKTAVSNDNHLSELTLELPNLIKFVEMGIRVADTQEDTAILISQCFLWIEQAGYSAIWQPIIQTAIQAISPKNKPLLILLQKQLGQLQRLHRELDNALQTFKQIESFAIKGTNLKLVSEIYINLCQVSHLAGDYPFALHYGFLALNQVPNNETHLIAITHRTLGILFQEQGDFHQAEHHLNQALAVSSKPLDDCLTLNALAVTKQKQGKYQAALNIYSKIAGLLDNNIQLKMRVEVELNRGTLYFEIGELEKAHAAFYQAERLLTGHPGLIFYKALTANNLGCILRDQSHFTTAESYFRHSIEQYSKMDAPIFLANVWHNLAKLLARQKRYEEAMLCCNKALALATQKAESLFSKEIVENCKKLQAELETAV